jgi:hypothetical protein
MIEREMAEQQRLEREAAPYLELLEQLDEEFRKVCARTKQQYLNQAANMNDEFEYAEIIEDEQALKEIPNDLVDESYERTSLSESRDHGIRWFWQDLHSNPSRHRIAEVHQKRKADRLH